MTKNGTQHSSTVRVLPYVFFQPSRFHTVSFFSFFLEAYLEIGVFISFLN